jgi:hypothetical protein
MSSRITCLPFAVYFIAAFGWKYTSVGSLFLLFAYGAGIVFFVIPLIPDRSIQASLEGITKCFREIARSAVKHSAQKTSVKWVSPMFQIFMALYGTLLLTTAWRAMARINGFFSLLTALGALIFVASDTLIAVNKFAFTVPYSQTLIMSTYFAAQYLIGLSVLGDHSRRQYKTYKRL